MRVVHTQPPRPDLLGMMSSILTWYGSGGILMLCCLLPITQRLLGQPRSDTVALTGGRVIATPDAPPSDTATVIVENGRIVTVGPRERVTIPAGARTIDCTGLTIVSSFQNSHVHFTEDKWTAAAGQAASKLTMQLQAMLTRYGFTTVVDTASLLSNTVAIRQRIDSGEVDGPRILTAGLALYPPNGVPYYVREVVPPELLMKRQKMALVPTLKLLGDGDDRQAIRNEVRDFARLGGQILFGTDVGYLTDYDPLREYQLMEAAGLTWRQILASLTTNPASRFGQSSRRGRAERGMDGDLVVLGADPSLSIRAFADVRYTIKAGRVIYER